MAFLINPSLIRNVNFIKTDHTEYWSSLSLLLRTPLHRAPIKIPQHTFFHSYLVRHTKFGIRRTSKRQQFSFPHNIPPLAIITNVILGTHLVYSRTSFFILHNIQLLLHPQNDKLKFECHYL